MILIKDGWDFVTSDGAFKLTTHEWNDDCLEFGCPVHNPNVNWPLAYAPYNWRTDRGIMERICEHGIGHPDIDSARYLERNGREYKNIHGCDGCCT